jgi:hypothetical protein
MPNFYTASTAKYIQIVGQTGTSSGYTGRFGFYRSGSTNAAYNVKYISWDAS